MSLRIGSKLGPFEVVAPLGAGGMGEVYEARDTRLDRRVALKVLPEPVAADPDRRARFEREARAISRLSHPHICALHDFGEASIDNRTVCYLVMEHIEGETVFARLRRGALPLERVLTAGRQIAEALAAAHRRGIVHRDLKPENVMLTRDGPKLLDFGLARPVDKTPSAELKKLPTVSGQRAAPLTEPGGIVGTPPYMSPEQLEGKDADARSDIFSFGALLFEMATGHPAFGGETLPAIMAAVIERQPEKVSRIRPGTPAVLDHVIERCLAKDPEDRWQSAADIAIELRWAASSDTGPGSSASLRPSARKHASWSIVGVLLLVLVLIPWVSPRSVAPDFERGSIRFPVHPPPGGAFYSEWSEAHELALSPDGTQLAFLATGDGEERQRIWLRRLAEAVAHPIPGTEGALSPFWSPDGRWLAFFARHKLLKVQPGVGVSEEICNTSGTSSGCWGPDDTILFHQFFSEGDGIYRVDANGGEPEVVVKREPGVEGGQRWPVLLPDGDRFLYYTFRRDAEGRGWFLREGRFSSGSPRTLRRLDSRVVIASGHLIYVEQGSLLARPFDLDRLRFTGEASKLGGPVPQFVTGWAPFTVSGNGVAAYWKASTRTKRLVWRDRTGKELKEALPPGRYGTFVLSRDGTRLVFDIREDGKDRDLWVQDLDRNMPPKRLVAEGGRERSPVWSPDGERIAYRRGEQGVFVRSLGRADEMIIDESLRLPWLSDWSSDGRWIACVVWTSETEEDIWLLPASGQGPAKPRLGTRFAEAEPVFSPKGRWLAYTSNESGRREVYVAPAHRMEAGVPVSKTGGVSPRWHANGNELFYCAPESGIHAVTIQESGGVLTAGEPTPLFECEAGDFAVAADGESFLVAEQIGMKPPVEVIVNWTKLLPAR